MADLTRSVTVEPGGARSPEPDSAREALSFAPPSSLPSRYSGVTELARGGMGRILVAHDLVLHREVAIKEALSSSDSAIRRFEREALLTARLQHPGIVSIYELARRPSGEPYLSMRRVRGESLDRAIGRAQTLGDRLALLNAFVSVVETMAYAHQQAVIHRDLKPSNVLLGEFGDTVVIDWGLAKDLGDPSPADASDAQDDAPSGKVGLTRAGSVLGTPAYMSPEQARGEAVDRRADVYALGAMLYELLSGRPPYPHDSEQRSSPAVLDGPPIALRDRVPDLASELATIVARAMAREPAARYPDAKALAEDLNSFRTGRLVRSHAYSARELLRRWARRNARVLGLSAAFLVALTALGGVGLRRIVRERDRANRESAAAQRVSDFMTGMFTVADPTEARGNTITAREILDKASADIETGLTGDPELQARLMKTMGDVYRELGLFNKAQPLFERAAGTFERVLGPDSPATLGAEAMVASVLFDQGHFAESEARARTVLERERRVLGSDNPTTLATMSSLAQAVGSQDRHPEAEQLDREVYDRRRRTLGPRDRRTLVSLGRIAKDVSEQRRYDEAEKLWTQAIAELRAALGPDDRETALALNGLSVTFRMLGRTSETEKLDREALAIRQKVLGPEHPETLQSMHSLSNDLFDLKRFADSEKLDGQIAAIQRRVLGPEHPSTLDSLNNWADSLQRVGRLAEAEATHRSVLETRKRVLGPEHSRVLLEMQALADVLTEEKHYAEARALLHELEAHRLHAVGPKDPGLSGVHYELALLDVQQGQHAEALAELEKAIDHHGLEPLDLLQIADDPGLHALHGAPKFDALVAKAKQLAAQSGH